MLPRRGSTWAVDVGGGIGRRQTSVLMAAPAVADGDVGASGAGPQSASADALREWVLSRHHEKTKLENENERRRESYVKLQLQNDERGVIVTKKRKRILETN